MLSTESFITDINAKALSMEEEEFQKNMESAQALLSGLLDSSENFSSQTDQYLGHSPNTEPVEPRPTLKSNKHQHGTTNVKPPEPKSKNEQLYGKDHPSLHKAPSISDLENKGAAELSKQEVSQLFREFPYLYSQVGDLTIGDVEDLLSNYKQLVFKYVCLAKGLGVTPPSLSTTTEGQISEQPSTAKDSEKSNEAVVNDDMQKGSIVVVNDSDEKLSSGLESTESKVLEDASVESHIHQDHEKSQN